ncbi:MAG: efflux RND transporter periplasmic adaptor subunit [bacterium]
MTRRRRILWLLPTAALVAALGGAWFAISRSSPTSKPNPGQRAKAPLVQVEEARAGDMEQVLELTGEVVATDSVVIAATKEGPITYCPWREGDEVRAGEKLVEIDREVHRAEVKAAEAALSIARAKLADLKAGARPEEIQKAEANVRRWKATLQDAREVYRRQADLAKKNFTPQQSLDQARERMEVAEAELAAAQQTLRMLEAGPTPTETAVQEAAVEEAAARLALAKAHLAECVLTAPSEGVITRVHVRPGDLAVPRSPLVEMYAPASLVVRFSVPEAHAAGVRPGLELEATLDAFPGRTFTAKVLRVYPHLDPRMRTRTVEARFDQARGLMPNQFARLKVRLELARDAVTIPAQAVLQAPDGAQSAYVVKEGKALRRDLQLGIEQGQRVQVTRGIEPGEQVVVKGNETLKEGAPVRLAGDGPKPKGPGGPQGDGSPNQPPEGEGGRE